jgi:hypothetical protein
VLDRFSSATPDQLLHVYLNDHRTGAIAAHQLAVRSRSANEGTEFGDFLDDFVPELEADMDQLDTLFDRCSIPKNRVKLVAARVATALGRFKLNGRLSGYSPLSRLLEFQSLSVGVLGKRQLWTTIAALPPDHPASGLDTASLIARADVQAQRLEKLSERAAVIAFTGREEVAVRSH